MPVAAPPSRCVRDRTRPRSRRLASTVLPGQVVSRRRSTGVTGWSSAISAGRSNRKASQQALAFELARPGFGGVVALCPGEGPDRATAGRQGRRQG